MHEYLAHKPLWILLFDLAAAGCLALAAVAAGQAPALAYRARAGRWPPGRAAASALTLPLVYGVLVGWQVVAWEWWPHDLAGDSPLPGQLAAGLALAVASAAPRAIRVALPHAGGGMPGGDG
jgi:hypothetical protein